jgi:cysteine-rich repeat protein
VEPPERCDDGGAEDADGCDHLCAVEPGWICFGDPSACYAQCGDGRMVGSEECDDGNHWNGDGCRSCVVLPGWECTGEPSVCRPAVLCGDGAIEGDERCDDGNPLSGDGCDAVCAIEPGFECTGEPSCCVDEPGRPCAAVPDAGLAAADAGLDPGGGAGGCSGAPEPSGALLLALLAVLLRGCACRSRGG